VVPSSGYLTYVIALRITVAVNLELKNHETKERTSCQETCRKRLKEAVTFDLPVKWNDTVSEVELSFSLTLVE
jgi:hypothetical protein